MDKWHIATELAMWSTSYILENSVYVIMRNSKFCDANSTQYRFVSRWEHKYLKSFIN